MRVLKRLPAPLSAAAMVFAAWLWVTADAQDTPVYTKLCTASPCVVDWNLPQFRLDNTPLAITDVNYSEVRWGFCPQPFGDGEIVPGLHNRIVVTPTPGQLWSATPIPVTQGQPVCIEILVLGRDGRPSGWFPMRALWPVQPPSLGQAPQNATARVQ